MKNYKLFLLMVVSILSLVFSAVVNAAAEKSAFDYSAEKMDCRIAPPVFDTEEADRNRDLLGAVSELDWSIGPEDAILTIIEYADFQCPYCADASLSLIEYQRNHSNDVRLVYRHFPLSFHEKAVPAALAANAAGYQGMFFEAEEFLFEKQSEWSVLENNEVFTEWLIQEFSKFADLDFDLWYLAFSDSDNEAAVRMMYSQVIKTGIISGTPTVFLNYTDSNYMFDDASLDSYIGNIRKSEYGVTECPDVVIEEGENYTAVLETEIGDVRVELFQDIAPNAVNSFINLAESGWFDGTTLARSYDNSVWMAAGIGDPGYGFDSEYDDSLSLNGAGYIGFVNSSGNVNPAEFFITDDIRSYSEQKIREDCAGQAVAEDAYDRYVNGKIKRFSAANTIFGRIIDEDLEKLRLLNEITAISRIMILR